MKKLIGLIVLTVMTVQVQSQDCRFLKNESDPFTGDIVKEIRVDLGNMVETYSLTFSRTGNDYKVLLWYAQQNTVNETSFVKFDSPLKFLQDNGNVFELKNSDYTSPTLTVISGVSIYSLTPVYSCDETALKMLTESPVKMIRFYINENQFDREIKGKKAAKIMQSAKCILN